MPVGKRKRWLVAAQDSLLRADTCWTPRVGALAAAWLLGVLLLLPTRPASTQGDLFSGSGSGSGSAGVSLTGASGVHVEGTVLGGCCSWRVVT